MWRRTAWQILLKDLNISSTTDRVTSYLLKILAILSDTTVRRYAVDREDLKPCCKSEKMPHFYKFFEEFTNHRNKTNLAVFFSCRPFPSILKYRDHRWDLPTIWKTRLFQTHIEQFSSDSRFFRTSTGMQSRQGAFDKSRFVMTFLTILGFTQMSCSFRLVLEWKKYPSYQG